MTNQEITQALHWRYAVKKFDANKKITSQDWSTLEESLVLAPSSYGLQPWKFMIIQNTALREKLKAVSWNQTQVTDCSHYVVLCYKEKMDTDHVQKYIDRIAEVRDVSKETLEGYKKMMIGDVVQGPRSQVIHWWAQRQVYIAMGFVMQTAAMLKIDSCPLEGLDANEYNKILDLNGTGWSAVAAVALGYRHAEDPLQNMKKVRFDHTEVIDWRK